MQQENRGSDGRRRVLHDLSALGLGLAGGIVGSLLILFAGHAPRPLEEHALLSGPFLAFLGVLILVVVFHRPLQQLLARGNLTLTWGDKTISIQEIEENFDQEMDARLEDLSAELEALREQVEAAHPKGGEKQDEDQEAASQAAALARITDEFRVGSPDDASVLYHLGTSKYEWRNLRTLAVRTGLSTSEVEAIAKRLPNLIVRGRGKSGNAIFRLTRAAKQSFAAVIAPIT